MLSSILSAALGAVLIAAGVPKLLRPQQFSDAVRGFQLLPRVAERIAARAIPPVELLVGLLLLTGVARIASALVAAALFLTFTLALSINLLRGNIELDCGCLGFASEKKQKKIGPLHVVRAAALTGASIVVVVLPSADATTHLVIGGVAVAAVGLLAVVRQILTVVTLGADELDSHLDNASNRYRAAVASTTSR